MRLLLRLMCTALFGFLLGGCLASTTSPVGVNCDFSQEKPLYDMPLDCQPGR